MATITLTENDFSASDFEEARAWLSDAFDNVDAWTLSEMAIARAIRKHYQGGVTQFLVDQYDNNNA
jgi:hypothetical protein